MGGLRNYGYKVNNGITYKRKRLKKLSKTIKLLSHCILKIDIDFPDDFGWKTPNGDFKSDNRLIRIQEDLQSLSSIYQEEELFLDKLISGNLRGDEYSKTEKELEYLKTIKY